MNNSFHIKSYQVISYSILIIVLLVSFFPFFWMISTSLMTLGETINRSVFPEKLQFINYLTTWNDGKFSNYLLNSVLITLVSVTGLLCTSILSAYAFAKIKFPGRDLLFFIILGTMMIPEIVTIMPHVLIIRGDIIPLPFGPSWMNSLQGITVPLMANAFSIFLLRQFFLKFPTELWEAARMDGCSHLRFLLTIVIPMSKPIIFTVGLFGFINAWNSFMWPMIITTTPEWRPLTVGIYSFITEAGFDTHLLMAASVISIIPVLIVYFFTQKQFTDSIATLGIKG